MASITYSPKHVLASTNTLIHTGRISVTQILITSSAAGVETVSFYDGTSAAGELKCRVQVPSNPTPQLITFKDPLVCRNGLFVTPGAADVSVWGTGAE
mgnify:CR=1 FL=1